ncbi:MAG: hypothetical protein ACM3IJ_02400 [Candidatus Levyibacteriota bacterium]
MKKYLLYVTVAVSVLCLSVIVYYLVGGFTDNINIRYKPQDTQLYLINDHQNDLLNVLATTLPEFAVKLADEKFNNLWQAHAAGRDSLVEASAENAKGDTVLQVETKFNDAKKEVVATPKISNEVKPGLYKLDIKIKTVEGKYTTITQDFTWGVLAINTNKGIYKVGEEVKIGMAVLDDFGATKCIVNKEGVITYGTAKVHLTITTPDGNKQELSTDNGTIVGSKECGDRTVTNIPDFLAQIDAREVGKYKLEMEAETLLGLRSITDTFIVQHNTPPFVIERTVFPTRIYPRSWYPVAVTVVPQQDYKGQVVDMVPSSFTIEDLSFGGKVRDKGDVKAIVWQVDWKKGGRYQLTYSIKFPRVAPEFYLIGPLTIDKYDEGRSWQVASDSLFSFIQEAHNTSTSGTSLAATFSTGATAGHLLVLVCARDATNASISTPGGWSRAWQYSSGGTVPKISMFYRLATAGYTTGTCSFSSSTGSKTAQILEFSGNSTSGYYDGSATANSSTACNSSPFTATTNNRTSSNPDVLMVSAFVSQNGSLTFSNHKTISGVSSVGFTGQDTYPTGPGFSNANMSADSAWGEAVNNPQVAQNDFVTLSGAGGRCSMGVASFNPPYTVSQGSYRFFDNANSITPGSPLAAVNTVMQLGFPNYPFRIRFLLDVDSASGTTMGLQSGDFILQYATMSATMASCIDVTQWDAVQAAAGGTDIAFYTNPDSGGSGTNISITANDPNDAIYTELAESYYEDNTNGPNGPNPGNITNDQNVLANNQAGLWDLSLVDNTDDSYSRHYCLRVINGDGTELDAYRNYPQVITVKTDVTIRGGSEIKGRTKIQ